MVDDFSLKILYQPNETSWWPLIMCKKCLEIVQIFQVVTYNKEGLPGKKLCIFSGD